MNAYEIARAEATRVVEAITSLPYYQLFTIYVGKDKQKSRNRQAISGFIYYVDTPSFIFLPISQMLMPLSPNPQ